MSILQEMWSIVMSVFNNASNISLIIMLVVLVGAGFMLGDLRRLFRVTTGALIIFGLLSLAYTITQGADPAALPSTAWANLKQMTVGNLVVMFMAFAIVISMVHLIGSAVGSGGGGGGGHGDHGHH
jgi:hypothetical protein